MLRFIVGVDERARMGADIERRLRVFYDMAEFQVVGMPGTLPCKSIRSIEQQVERILEELFDTPAYYFIAVSRGIVDFTSTCGPVPTPVTVMSAVDRDGLVHRDHEQRVGYHTPWDIRPAAYSCPPDALDLIFDTALVLAGCKQIPVMDVLS